MYVLLTEQSSIPCHISSPLSIEERKKKVIFYIDFGANSYMRNDIGKLSYIKL